MQEYLDNGTCLGWLINRKTTEVEIYRQGQAVEILTNPEIRIYYNNARAAYQDRNPLKIATSVPLGNNPEIAQEILRGIALLQQELNDEQAKNPEFHFLQVVVANDNNSPVDAKDRAEKFVKDRSIIAVVGHNASAASEAAKDSYVQGKIVALSPTSFSPKISGNGYVYKMVPDLETFATTLSEYIRKQTDKLIIQNPTNSDNIWLFARF